LHLRKVILGQYTKAPNEATAGSRRGCFANI
jgi:hypothetical protein